MRSSALSPEVSKISVLSTLPSLRKVMIMVKAGAAVDAVIEQLLPLLEADDIVIDGGNSLYTDTERRDAWLTPLGLRLTKDALNFTIDAPSLEAAIAIEDRNQVLCTQTPDFDEGVRAFLEKRDPVYGSHRQ